MNDRENRRDSSSQVPLLIQEVLEEFKDVMSPKLSKKLSSRHEVDHEIELEQGAKPLTLVSYRMAPLELEELRRQFKDLLDVGYICPFKALIGVPVLFEKKKDGSLHMCINYCVVTG